MINFEIYSNICLERKIHISIQDTGHVQIMIIGKKIFHKLQNHRISEVGRDLKRSTKADILQQVTREGIQIGLEYFHRRRLMLLNLYSYRRCSRPLSSFWPSTGLLLGDSCVFYYIYFFVCLFLIYICIYIYILKWGAQNQTQQSKYGLIRAEQQSTVGE